MFENSGNLSHQSLLKISLDHQLIRFILAGSINTVFGYTVFASLIKLGLHYTLAIFLGTCLGILFNFHTFGHFVFHQLHYKRIPKSVISYGIIYVLNVSTVKSLLLCHFNIYVAGAISTVLMAFFSYLFNKRWVFKS